MQNKTIYTLELKRDNKNSKPIQYYINDNGCHVCTSHKGNVSNGGYIRIRYNSNTYRIHILLYKLLVGEVPENMKILHKCDNPLCLNVEHYELGTQGENVIDMYNKGRRDHKKDVRLSIEQKIEMCENKDGLKNSEIREKYGIGETTIKSTRKAFREGRLQL